MMPSVSYAGGMGVGNSGLVLRVKKELVQLLGIASFVF